jgi:tetratricopeptide (TPR) repeat protein
LAKSLIFVSSGNAFDLARGLAKQTSTNNPASVRGSKTRILQTMLQISEPIVPFWLRLRAISVYALRNHALATIALLAVCRLLTFLPAIGWLIGLAIWVGVYKYGFEVLRASANGRLDPPLGGMNVDESLGWSALRLQAGFVVLNVLGYLILGPVGGSIVSVILAFGFPGMMMSLAMDENVLHALNPSTWLQVMARLGWPYFVAAALCLVINASMANVQALLDPYMPAFIAIVVFYFLANYAVITTFHLMGYLIYQYHDELGYVVEERLPVRRVTDDPDQALLDQASGFVQAGNPEAATELLRGHLRERGGSDALHTQYRKLLRLADNRDELLHHGRDYISALLAQEKDKRAVDIARECTEIDPAFAPAQSEQVAQLAQKAASVGLTQVAIRLLSGFHKRYPKSKDIPQNYLLAAKLLHERMGEDRQAQALLRQLQTVYPDHALRPDIDAQLALVERMMPASAATQISAKQ